MTPSDPRGETAPLPRRRRPVAGRGAAEPPGAALRSRRHLPPLETKGHAEETPGWGSSYPLPSLVSATPQAHRAGARRRRRRPAHQGMCATNEHTHAAAAGPVRAAGSEVVVVA